MSQTFRTPLHKTVNSQIIKKDPLNASIISSAFTNKTKIYGYITQPHLDLTKKINTCFIKPAEIINNIRSYNKENKQHIENYNSMHPENKEFFHKYNFLFKFYRKKP